MSCPTVHIPHLPGGWSDIFAAWEREEKPFGWFISEMDGLRQVAVVCGGCGKHTGHLVNHSIDEKGVVRASILCNQPVGPKDENGQRKNCSWHVYGILDEWDRPAKKVREEVGLPLDHSKGRA